VGLSAIIKLADRSARRNHLYLFAWLCAIAVPLGLQLLASSIEDVRDYLAYYRGPLSLYMFFAMTYGFATVFVSYYVVGGLRKGGTLDLLRVSGAQPWEVVTGVFLTLQRVLAPPLIVFALGFTGYLLLFAPDSFILGQSWWMLLGMGLVVLLNQMILALTPCLALFRREALLALLAAVLVLPLNALPVILLYVMALPVWAFVLLMLGILGLLFGGSILLVARLWPPQQRPLE
jgi:hypothetical protein